MQAGSADGQRYKSSLDGLLTILDEEGVRGLYKGVGSKLVQSVLNAAILFVSQRRVYEMTKQVSQQPDAIPAMCGRTAHVACSILDSRTTRFLRRCLRRRWPRRVCRLDFQPP